MTCIYKTLPAKLFAIFVIHETVGSLFVPAAEVGHLKSVFDCEF